MTTLQKQDTKFRQKRIAVHASPMTMVTSLEKPSEKIFGLHVFGNLYDVDPALASDVDFCRKIMLDAVNIAKMTLVEQKAWAFGDKKGGVSVICLVTESHMVLHTWNEYKYATLDIYTCGENSNPQAAFEYIIQQLKPKKHQMFYANRSSQ